MYENRHAIRDVCLNYNNSYGIRLIDINILLLIIGITKIDIAIMSNPII